MLRRQFSAVAPRSVFSWSSLATCACASRFFLPGTDRGIIRSRLPSIMPALEKETTLWKQFQRASEQYGPKTALICGVTGAERTFSAVQRRTEDYAKVMQHAMHVSPGDTVMLIAPNCLDYPSVFFGALAIGARVLPVNPTYTPQEISHMLCTAERVKAIFVYEPFKPAVQAALGLVQAANANNSNGSGTKTALPQVFVFTDKTELPGAAEGKYADLRPHRTADRHDTAVIPFSSGTTGAPKQIHLTNYSIMANILQTQGCLNVGPDAVFMQSLPLFHIYGMVAVMMLGHVHGAKQVVMPKFDIQAYFDLVAKYGATHIFVAPPMFLAFLKTPHLTLDEKKQKFKTVKRVVSGAAPLGEQLQAEATVMFPPDAAVAQGFGLSELSPVASVSCPNVPGFVEHKKSGHVGGPVADTEFRLVCTESGEDVKAFGQPGEIWVRGPQQMRGYHREEDNVKAFDDHKAPMHLRWFKTGDIAVANEDYTITITDRAKDLIKSNGMQCAPAELEALLMTHKAVAQAVVVGLPTGDGTGNELPYAQVALQPAVVAALHGDEAKTKALVDELKKFVSDQTASYKHLRGGLDIVKAVPTSPTGKLLRRVVRDEKMQKR